MRILSVSCFNLNSLRGKQPHTLNFETAPLDGCGLFAISGPTGAGKTTLLDAITLALYGETPRQSKGEALSSHGAVESWAEVEYSVGTGRYLARWSLKRAFKKVDGNPTVTMQVSPWPRQDGDWQTQRITESIAKNQELTGMRYEQFTRSVLLAQGGFAKFLEAKDDERAVLLERMTGTEIYKTLSQNAHARLRAENEAEQALLAQLGAVRLLSAEELAEKAAELAGVKDAESAARATLKTWDDQVKWHERWAELTTKSTQATTDVAQAETSLAARQTDLDRLAAHEPAERFALPWRDAQRATAQAESLENERLETARQLAEARQQHLAAMATMEIAQHAVDAATAELTKQQPALQQALAQLPNLETLTRNCATAETNRQASALAAADAGKRHYTLTTRTATERAELVALKIWLQANATDERLAEALGRLDGLLNLRQRAEEQFKARDKDLRAAEEALAKAKTEETAHYKNAQATATALAGLRAQLTQQHSQYAGLQTAAAARQANLGQLLKNKADETGNCYALLLGKQLLRDHAAQLRAGHECPLCGAMEHPVSSRHTDVSDEAIDALVETHTVLQKAYEGLAAEQKINDELLTTLRGQAVPAALPDPAAAALSLPEAGRSARLLLRDLAAAPASLAELSGDEKRHRERAAEAVARQEAAQGQVVELRKTLAEIKQEGQEATAEIERIAADFNTVFDRKNPAQLLDELRHRATAFSTKKDRRSYLEPALAGANATLAALTDEQTRLLADTEKLTAAAEAAEAVRRTCADQIAAAHPGFAGPQVALNFYENGVRTAVQKLEAQQRTERTAAATVQRLTEREEAQIAQRDALQTTATDLLAALRRELPAAGLSADPAALDSILLPDAERDHLRRLRQTLDTALSNARSHQSRCAAELHALEAQPLGQQPLEAVLLSRDTTHALHLELVKQHTLLENELATEQANQATFATLGERAAAQRRETLRWKTLHDLIGSGDGTRFSRFAQGLTLARLVGLANDHLRQFNDRYQLRRKDTTSLALLVADTYDNCLRDASTLSGGETFLVSLALALGLSELASNAARIDSLFIDEGFGTLDPDTLHVALAALGQLRDRGKTIGIITHVEADRLEGHIDTRVLVERVGQGSSRLRVLPEVVLADG